MISCTVARCVWALSDDHLTEHMCNTEEPSAKRWLFSMLETLSKDDFAKLAITLWAIWHARRKIIFEGEFQSSLSTHLFVQSYIHDLSIAGMGRWAGATQTRPMHPRWIAPNPGCAKLNADVAMAKAGPGGAVAAVCRRESGTFLGASSLTVEGISDPAVLEAIACREALALAQDLQLQRITVASDCLSVINAMSLPYARVYSVVLEEVKADASRLVEFSFKHENRASNSEAHRLAQIGRAHV